MSTSSKKIDYIIVGQGICGSNLAFRMIEAGLKIRVFDVSKFNSGSRVAAGIVNPVTGRKMVKSWMIDELLVEVKSLYKRMESTLGINCLQSMPVYKLFSTVKEQNDWLLKREQENYRPYLSDVFHPRWPGVETPYGAGIIQNGWWLDMRSLMDSMQAWLEGKDAYEAGKFNDEELDTSIPDVVTYREWTARGIVFCEGHQGRANRYFDHLPLSYAKGEILIIDCPELSYTNGILNKNGFIIPLGSGRFKVGATFDWSDESSGPTEAGRQALIKKFKNICSFDFTIIDHEASFRPTVRDRRPLLGSALAHANVYNFNGMGTKGVSLSAWFSRHLLEHICDNKKLIEEVDIRRYQASAP